MITLVFQMTAAPQTVSSKRVTNVKESLLFVRPSVEMGSLISQNVTMGTWSQMMDALKSARRRRDGFVRECLQTVRQSVETEFLLNKRNSVMIATFYQTMVVQANVNSKANKTFKNQPRPSSKPKQSIKSSKVSLPLPLLPVQLPPLQHSTPLSFSSL